MAARKNCCTICGEPRNAHGVGAAGCVPALRQTIERLKRELAEARTDLETLKASARGIIAAEIDDDNCTICDAFYSSNEQCLPWCCIGKLRTALEAAGEDNTEERGDG